MSMMGEYVRLTPAEFDRAVADPAWAEEYVEELADAEPEHRTDTARCRFLSIDRAWDTLAFLLRRTGFPLDVVHGGADLPEAEDWGYGPPRHLTPAQVRTAADAMAALSGVDLVRDVTMAELAGAGLYPRISEEETEWLGYVVDHYRALVPFFRAAARDGDTVVTWIA
ncbi:YfbM family protein [Kitasatospora sp. NPDC088346]|uniref:YfbM family protein n=1 Tax=Kitasatospora sp. NPDC088346 TaxID=3364073 RepID=UPI0038205E87